MTSKPRAKEILISLLSNYERLYVENYALKTMLSTSDCQEIRDTWEATLQLVLKQPEVEASLAELHAKFGAACSSIKRNRRGSGFWHSSRDANSRETKLEHRAKATLASSCSKMSCISSEDLSCTVRTSGPILGIGCP